MFRRYLFIALTIGVAAGFIGLGSALFTDSKSVGNNTFSTGTVNISTSPTTALVTFSNMAPGDRVVAPITVNNAGSLDLRYALTSVTSGTIGLNTQLVLTIKEKVTACALPAAVNTNFDAPGAPGGNVLYTGILGTATTAMNLIGDPATGFQANDRTLVTVPATAPALSSEVLCFSVTLPQGTDNSYQGASTTATFAFVAEQIKNNP